MNTYKSADLIFFPPYASKVDISQTFVCPAIFSYVDEQWDDVGFFSLCVEITQLQSKKNSVIATIHFLVENAPSEWLTTGREFFLLDGNKFVCRGKVI